MSAQQMKLNGASGSPSKRWADQLDDDIDDDDDEADLEGFVTPAPCAAGGGNREKSKDWQLLWCSEKCFKRDSKPLLDQFVSISTSLGGSLVPLRKARRFETWSSEETKAGKIALLVDWREAKPCVQILAQLGEASAPSLVIVLYDLRKAFARAVAWAQSLEEDGFRTPVHVVQSPEEVEKVLREHLLGALPRSMAPEARPEISPEACAQHEQPEPVVEVKAMPQASTLSGLATPATNTGTTCPPSATAPLLSSTWVQPPTPCAAVPQNPFAPPMPMPQNHFAPPMPQNPFAPPMPQNPFAPAMPMPQNPFAPPMRMPQNPFAPPMMPMPQNPCAPPMAPKDADQKDADQKAVATSPVPDTQPDFSVSALAKNPYAPPGAFDMVMQLCPSGNIRDLNALLAAAEPETYED